MAHLFQYLLTGVCSSLLLLGSCQSQLKSRQAGSDQDSQAARNLAPAKEMTVAFYNVENLFDPTDDSEKIDEDFLPQGRYKWTQEKYEDKLGRIARVISQIGDEDGPEIIGLAEIENRRVLEDLVARKEIEGKYKIAHRESPDVRGIDVAVLYDPQSFGFQSLHTIRAVIPGEDNFISRDILIVEGLVGEETLYIMVNHWPSRREGQQETEARRVSIAKQAKAAVDSIHSVHADANILVMGDFNDDPNNKSIAGVLGGKKDILDLKDQEMFNPMFELHDPESTGTLSYRGRWNLFDQILVSEELISDKEGLSYVNTSAAIYNPEFLRVGGNGRSKDNPRRAIFRGEFQERGYSDHFPVYLMLNYR